MIQAQQRFGTDNVPIAVHLGLVIQLKSIADQCLPQIGRSIAACATTRSCMRVSENPHGIAADYMAEYIAMSACLSSSALLVSCPVNMAMPMLAELLCV